MMTKELDCWWAIPLKARDEFIVFQAETVNQVICFLNFYFKGQAFDCCRMVEDVFKNYKGSNSDYSEMFREYISDAFKASKTYIPPEGSLISGRLFQIQASSNREKSMRRKVK